MPRSVVAEETAGRAAGTGDAPEALPGGAAAPGTGAPRSHAAHPGPASAMSGAPATCEPLPVLHAPRTRRAAGRRLTLAAFVLAALALVAVVAAGIAARDAATVADFSVKNLAPCWEHPFGTDRMGRDMLARTLAGLSTSVLVGLLAASVSSVIALALGCVAALGGRRADAVVTWLIDLMMGVPHIVLLILISYALGKGFWGVTVGVALTHWASLTRVVRAEVMQCRASTYMAAAGKLGAGRVAVAVRHVLPYVLPQYLVGLILLFPHAILHEAAITFLGFGLPPEQPAIGVILSESMSYLSAGMWWLAVFPGVALILTVMLFDVAGTSLRKLVDPHSSQE